MRKAIEQILAGLSSVETGVETVFNAETYRGFINLIDSVYGSEATRLVKSFFVKRDVEGKVSYTCPMEGVNEAFAEGLMGKLQVDNSLWGKAFRKMG